MDRSRLRQILIASAVLLFGGACARRALTGSETGGSGGNLVGAGGIGGSRAAGSGGAAGTTTTGAAGDGQACARLDFAADAVRTDVLILLDASSSMNSDTSDMMCDGGCGAGSKWAQAVAAVNAIVASVGT